MRNLTVVLLLVLSGCSVYQPLPQKAPPSVWVREVEPPTIRYQIRYQNRGLQVDPDFAAIDRNGEYVVTPQM
jgi:NAD(P)H-nitrite reductase large subunit